MLRDLQWMIRTRSEAIQQLRSYFRQLRPPGDGWIGSVSKGSAYNHRITNMSTCGPFASVAEFHDFIVALVKDCPRPKFVSKYRNQLSDTYCIHLAHADPSWDHVLVDVSTGNITGILD